ncbi:NUDIX domain-containing protein [Paenochrobactrum glaciei]|uniref:NUDIX domain-containing protein n=1 Tax=Paenochrobactrum glaciei TaxID=486407 RepID=A0ABN1G703_9HYPH
MTEIKIAAAALMRADGATLLVRKRGTTAFMQPGGKIDAGETPLTALCRELKEELGLEIKPEEPVYLGCFSAPAANETGATVTAEIFQINTDSAIQVQAEIEDARWVLADSALELELAPLTRDHILPLIWK